MTARKFEHLFKGIIKNTDEYFPDVAAEKNESLI